MAEVQYKLEQTLKALRASAIGISMAVENEAITGDEVFSLLQSIADQFESVINMRDHADHIASITSLKKVR